jgi:hypothetical protein
MKDLLRLSEDQQGKISPIIEEQVKRRNELIKKYQNQDRPDMGALAYELQVQRVKTASQLQYYLTNDQMLKYGIMQQEEDQRIMKEKPPQEDSPQKPQRRVRGPGFI